MTIDSKLKYCSFCQKSKEAVKKLIVSDNVAICNECIDLCVNLMHDDDEQEQPQIEVDNKYDPRAIKEYLDQYIIGQHSAKRVLSVAIANHYKRINRPPQNLEIQKGNVLLVGPTGSGKTLIARTVAKYLNVPFVVADATSLTEAGYVGDDVESMISMLVQAAGGDVQRAQRGIVFIDEIDKIARKSEHTSITRDVSGEGVQQALLKLVEGTKCRVNASGERKHPGTQMIEVDTTNILFIAGGAFVGLRDIIQKRLQGNSIGFAAKVGSGDADDDLKKVGPEDLMKFGMIPEFIGRFTTTVVVEELARDDLIKILTEIKNSYVEQYKYLLQLDNITIEWSRAALEALAERTLHLKTGARGLHTEIERVLMPVMYNSRLLCDTTIVVESRHVDDPEMLLREYDQAMKAAA